MRGGWRCVRKGCGALFASTCGRKPADMWPVVNWASTLAVIESMHSNNNTLIIIVLPFPFLPSFCCLQDALFGVFGVSRGPAHLSFVQCSGSEDSIFDCPRVSATNTDLFCYQTQPVGVICIPENETGS